MKRTVSLQESEWSLWVGNMPTISSITALRDYFLEAMPTPYDLLSLSWNPDARYAFANFATDIARHLAIQQAAARLFEGKRLDCRVRHSNSSRSSKINYGLRAGSPSKPIAIADSPANDIRGKVEERSHWPEAAPSQRGKAKYFILKSRSVDALERSLESGVWHVPLRHVERLNHAFQTASTVHLIFSVNGSGKYFGHAVMQSEVNVQDDDPTPPAEALPSERFPVETDYLNFKDTDQAGTELPSSPTFRTQLKTPYESGSFSSSITFQPERRRIVWEAPWLPSSDYQSDPDASPTTAHSGSASWPSSPAAYLAATPQPSNDHLERCTSPCRVKWMSTDAVPFCAIRGLRNSWNSGKEIHVARNVTAVEPGAATSLLFKMQRGH